MSWRRTKKKSENKDYNVDRNEMNTQNTSQELTLWRRVIVVIIIIQSFVHDSLTTTGNHDTFLREFREMSRRYYIDNYELTG